MANRDLDLKKLSLMLQKHGKTKKPQKLENAVFEADVDVRTGTLQSYMEDRAPDADLVPTINEMYSRIESNVDKVVDAANKTRVITFKQRMAETQKQIDQILLQANSTLRQISKF